MSQPLETSDFVEGVTFTCWKCFLRSSAGFTTEGEPLLLHEEPYCEAWEKIETADDASDYMTRCRAARTS